jgi:hypothetical protein
LTPSSRSATTRAAYEATRRGGTLCVIGAGAADDTVGFDALARMRSGEALRTSIAI